MIVLNVLERFIESSFGKESLSRLYPLTKALYAIVSSFVLSVSWNVLFSSVSVCGIESFCL